MLWQLYDYKGTINSFYHKQIHLHPTGVRRNMCFPCNNDDDDDDNLKVHIHKVVLRLPDSWSNWTWKCWFLRRGENRSTRRKTSRSKGKNQQQTRPTYGVDTGIWTRATLVGGERSHHCAIPCSPISYSENLSFLPYGFSSPPQLRIKQKEFTEEWNLRISSNLFHRWEKSTPLVSTLFVAIMAFTSDLFLQKLMDKLTFLTESDTRTPLLGTTGSAPYTCAELYHLGSGSHGKLFHPYYN